MPLDPRDAAHIWDIIRAAEAVADNTASLKLGTCLIAHSP
jgi:hypothetical protein